MSDQAAQPTFLFHDYETAGIHPALDRPVQFAAIRTDDELNEIGEPVMFYCRLPVDYLPSPEATLITGITPQTAQQQGVCEAEFIARIHEQFSQAGTCILGYNNIRFDDEVTRYTLYRNFYDPYAYSWQQGNSRWDLLDVVRTFYALRPDGIQWPEDEDGKPSFKLERLTAANGIEHGNAHDALADVRATIALARLLRQAQPKLFDYLFELRSKHKVKALLDVINSKPLVHVSGMFSAWQGCASWIAPLAWHPDNANAVICVNLNMDLTPLVELTPEQLHQRLYTRRDDLGELAPVPVKLVHINKCPALAKAAALTEQRADELGIDRARCRQSLDLLRRHPEIREKVVALYQLQRDFPPVTDVDAALYQGGFFSAADKAAMAMVRNSTPDALAALPLQFSDARLPELLFRYRARNYPHTLSEQEWQRWRQHCQDRLAELAEPYMHRLEQLVIEHQEDEHKLALLQAVARYVQSL
ncbi:exodeoxyribonuclease-1 [Oceanisphaera litoralis]|uniref:exodeoxyribonuclease I n=1 Tax=Oceanisphaera litoralis TaxID=225144 RepID=UPI0019576240|nr:exodeoxyribonuclease I [Oceanisphaera litoralis]MBM7455925.1 exodeoxyribonuclease-1 [Oceanisphaera litoralis]